MSERDLDQFLTDEERALLDADRRIEIARTLAAQANLLTLYGSTNSHIHENVANMRATFNQLPTESIQKVQKSISEHTLALVGVQPVLIARPEAIPIGSDRPDESPSIVEALDSPVQIQAEAPVVVDQPQALNVETVSVSEEDFDERQPKELSPQLNNLFKRLITFEQRSAIPNFSDEQNEALVDLMGGIYERGSLRPEEGSKQMNRLRRLLNGDSPKDIAKDDGVDTTAIGNAFRVSLPGLYFRHKHDVARGFADILAMQPTQVTPEQTTNEEQTVSEVEAAEIIFERSKPGEVSIALKNLFRLTLTEEQCIELSYFDNEQTTKFYNVLEGIYSQRALKKSYIPMQLNRIELALRGAGFDEIAHNEGSQKNTVRQSFYVSLAEFFASHKREVVSAFERIQERSESTGEATAVDSGEYPHALDGVVHDDIEVSDETIEDQRQEPLVAMMLSAYNTNDPEALRGISDLFSVSDGVVKSSEASIEAARYLAQRIQQSGISLGMSIDNPTARASVERLLYGITDGETRKWFTLSEILVETPEVLRGNKLRSVSGALGKITRQFERPSLVKEDPREKQIESLRNDLHKYTELPPELAELIIDRAIEKDVEFSGDLGKALIQLHRIASGVGLSDTELKIVRLFTTPRPSAPPRSVPEIKEVLIQEQGRNGSTAKHLENGYVSSMLLRVFDKIIVQRRDG